jgi:hypothetical protein
MAWIFRLLVLIFIILPIVEWIRDGFSPGVFLIVIGFFILVITSGFIIADTNLQYFERLNYLKFWKMKQRFYFNEIEKISLIGGNRASGFTTNKVLEIKLKSGKQLKFNAPALNSENAKEDFWDIVRKMKLI